jgi:hypothetical protein
MPSYEYKFVKIEVKVHMFKGVLPKENYQEIIHQHSRDGWRLVQIFAPPVKGYGMADFYELIFEREIRLSSTDYLSS